MAPTNGGMREYISICDLGSFNPPSMSTFGRVSKLYSRERALKNAPNAPVNITVASKGTSGGFTLSLKK